MSTRYSIAQRTPLLNSLFASAACALTLTLTAGPAFASPGELERVEVRGRVVEAPVRYDVTASCAGIERQLQKSLQETWRHERLAGRVTVQFLMQGDDIEGVSAKGMINPVNRAVRKAVRDLECGPQLSAAARIYRFNVEFVDPDARDLRNPAARSALASAQPTVRVALAKD
jgi:hypothetical protein